MLKGIKDGMVMQRNAFSVADITVFSEQEIKEVKYSVDGVTAEADVAFVADGEYKITGIPTGGPYTLKVDGEIFKNIYVGDLWILAGQSNMQGVGRLRESDYNFMPDESVRALFMDGKWRPARHPMHSSWVENGEIYSNKITETVSRDEYQGVGLGLKFAQVMKQKTGVPQGLICTAYGGSPLKMWLPSLQSEYGEKSLYKAMYNRVLSNGKNVAGMLWFQGCADAFDCESAEFKARTLELFSAVRKDFGDFPIVQFQIGRVVYPAEAPIVENWMKIREIQRNLHRDATKLYTLGCVDKGLDDLIHLNADSLDELGKNAAEVMLEMSSENLAMQELESITLTKDEKSEKAVIIVEFKNIVGVLRADGRPNGFSVTNTPYTYENDTVFDVKLVGNKAVISLWCSKNEAIGKYLNYGSGLNPYCNLKDGAGRAILCFGPIKINGERVWCD